MMFNRSSFTPEDIRHMTHAQLVEQPWEYFTWFPCMDGPDVREFERILASEYIESGLTLEPGPFHVLEWGCGGSTLYFARMLHEQASRPYTWTAVEHDQTWADRIAERVSLYRDVGIVLFDMQGADPRTVKQSRTMEAYVNWPAEQPMKWDLIVVDGRWRRRCVMLSPTLLTPHGVCLLHDAEREYYHCAFSAFPYQRRIPGTKWWEGRLMP